MKKIIRPLAVIAVFILVLVALDYILYPCTFIRSDIHRVQTEQVQDLILGGSHGKMNISPEEMQTVNGRTGHNLCVGGEYPVDSYYLLQLLIEKGKKPERVIYAISPEYFMNEKEEGNNYLLFFHEFPLTAAKVSYFAKTVAKCNFRTLLFPWYEYSLSYELSQVPDTLRRKNRRDYSADSYATKAQKYHSDGFIERYPVDSENFNYGGLHEFSAGLVREDQMEWMRRLIDLCKKEDIRFVCVMAPIPGPTLKHFSNGFHEVNSFVGEFFSENEVEFVNFNDPAGDLYKAFTHKVNAYTDLDGHMNGDAARAFSSLLASLLE